jgi:IrrE N-terminal-like domain
VDWPTAHKIAMITASQVLHDTCAGNGEYVDVFAALTAEKVPCMAQPLDGLAGAYVGPQSAGPAVMVNSVLSEIPIRHTAAHELGHHAFGHESKLDEQDDPELGSLGKQLPDEEKLAEAFAAWFLMPRQAVIGAMRRAEISRPAGPVDVHQISCWLGTSFAGTARHLANLRLADARQAREWNRAWYSGGARVRAALARTQGSPPERVWLIRPAADHAVLHVLPGDCLVCPGGYLPETLPAGLEECLPGQLTLEPLMSVRVTGALIRSAPVTVHEQGSRASISVTLVPPPRRLGIDVAWGPHQDLSIPEPEKP